MQSKGKIMNKLLLGRQNGSIQIAVREKLNKGGCEE
jgi:hypothetical protein